MYICVVGAALYQHLCVFFCFWPASKWRAKKYHHRRQPRQQQQHLYAGVVSQIMKLSSSTLCGCCFCCYCHCWLMMLLMVSSVVHGKCHYFYFFSFIRFLTVFTFVLLHFYWVLFHFLFYGISRNFLNDFDFTNHGWQTWYYYTFSVQF